MMQDKTILKVPSFYSHSKKIVKIQSSTGLYLDDKFFSERMDEDTLNDQSKSYPVNLIAVKVDWMVEDQDDCGRNFLQ